jgi:uncharacterized membrane-anchored protein
MQPGFFGAMITILKTFVLTIVPVGTLLFFICSSATAQGEIYKWTDPQGRLHFSNAPTENAEAVDDVLPPASSFTASPESTPTSTASNAPSLGTDSPPQSTTAQAPTEDRDPPVEEPAAESETAPTPEEPPQPSALADVPGINDPADLSNVPGIGDPAALSQEESSTE